ncbi:MAG: hypothetical protein LBD13_03735 [Spirochaetaceae bacterium]|jgi:hypothetical protein|nr:hypothetical protein [Spirochaetaceae bacterium]
MKKPQDWFPRSRAAALQMARVWENIIIRKGAVWNIRSSLIVDLHSCVCRAQAAFDRALSSERTPEVTAGVNSAFAALEACMQDLKERCFAALPLGGEDFRPLLLPSQEDAPQGPLYTLSRPLLLLYYEGYNTVAVDITGMPGENTPPDCYVSLFQGIMPRSGAPPQNTAGSAPYLANPPCSGQDLFKWLDTKRKRERAWFPLENACKTAYFCSRYVNGDGQAGQWGPIAAIVIPGSDNPFCPIRNAGSAFRAAAGPETERRRPSRKGPLRGF